MPLSGAATIMSYCHLCDGYVDNIAHTFGGSRTGPDTWENDNGVVSKNFSTDSYRVAEKMYNTVKSKGSCVIPTNPVPKQICTTNTDCDDGNACNGIETCDSGKCVAGTPMDCEDGDICTTNYCDFVTGTCKIVPESPCTDGK